VTIVTLVVALLGWAAGRHPLEMVLLCGAVAAPQFAAWTVPLVVLRGLRDRRSSRSPAVLALVAVSSELQAGATLRGAIINIGRDDDRFSQAARLARAGRPMAGVLEAMAGGLGSFGRLASAALGMAASTGGSAAAVVDQLVAQVMSLDELERERRAAMAPILLQAVVVGGAPIGVLLTMLVSGRLVELAAAGTVEAGMVGIGSALVLTGAGLVARIAHRAVRS
jgi:hypothetical protein